MPLSIFILFTVLKSLQEILSLLVDFISVYIAHFSNGSTVFVVSEAGCALIEDILYLSVLPTKAVLCPQVGYHLTKHEEGNNVLCLDQTRPDV